jgi:hypothetical protein
VHNFDGCSSGGLSPTPPLVRELMPPQAVSCCQGDDIDALLVEGLVDLVAQLLTLVGLVSAASALLVDGVHADTTRSRAAMHAHSGPSVPAASSRRSSSMPSRQLDVGLSATARPYRRPLTSPREDRLL